jgi:hypothetical protein
MQASRQANRLIVTSALPLIRSHYRCALMNKFLGSQHDPEPNASHWI